MDRPQTVEQAVHVIDITQDRQVTESTSQQNEDLPSTSINIPVFQHPFPTTNGTNERRTGFARRGNGRARRRSPLNSGYWISIELVITVSQITAAIIVLSLSRHEHPHAPLFTWVIGYASGCVATLPLLFWRFYYRNQTSDQDSVQPPSGSLSAIATTLTSSSNATNSVVGTHNTSGTARPALGLLSTRYLVLKLLILLYVLYLVNIFW